MRRRGNIILIVCVLVLLFFLTRGVLEQILHLLQRPFVTAGTWISGYDPTRVGILEERVAALAIEHTRLEQLERENASLKATLGFVERQDVRTVMASVVARSRDTQTSLFSIDRGRDDSIRVGDPVIVKDGILVGKVSSVTPKSATVLALTDPSMATAVGILNQTQTIGVAQGMSGNLLRLKFIPQNTKLSINDLVVTSGLESSIPSDLLIGLVNDVSPEENAPFLEAVIEPLVDMHRYTTVHILIQEPL